MVLLQLVCCAPKNKGVDNNKAMKLARIRDTRKHRTAQLNKTLNVLSVLVETSTADGRVITRVHNALHDISLLSKAIHDLDLSIEDPPK